MKLRPQFLPPRQSVVYAITRRMLDETAMNAQSFAMAVAELYIATTAPDVRQVKFRIGSEDDARHNAQILRRYMDGTLKTLPADLEDAWVMALPAAYRDECETLLARRRGRMPARTRPRWRRCCRRPASCARIGVMRWPTGASTRGSANRCCFPATK